MYNTHFLFPNILEEILRTIHVISAIVCVFRLLLLIVLYHKCVLITSRCQVTEKLTL